MADKPKTKNNNESNLLSRREVLVGAAGAAIVATAVKVNAAPTDFQLRTAASLSSNSIRRYMAAAATIGDGRVLVTGGYNRAWTSDSKPMAMSSAVLVEPSSGHVSAVAPMSVSRARHAAVMLKDGRVAVIGGIGMNPTASIEIYDPSTNSWTNAGQLAQPRYDHTAVYDGSSIHVIGGSGLTMISGVETIYPGGNSWL